MKDTRTEPDKQLRKREMGGFKPIRLADVEEGRETWLPVAGDPSHVEGPYLVTEVGEDGVMVSGMTLTAKYGERWMDPGDQCFRPPTAAEAAAWFAELNKDKPPREMPYDKDDDDDEGDDEPEFLSQIGLLGAIWKYLDRCGIKVIQQEKMNAMIEPANEIMRVLAQPDRPAPTAASGAKAWLNSAGVGSSSLYLLGVVGPAAGLKDVARYAMNHDWVRGKNVEWVQTYPYDPSDFKRCVDLLDAVPELRPHLGVLKDVAHGPVWNAYAERWDELEALLKEELPTGNAPRLYDRMKLIRDEADAKLRASPVGK